jgi:hypothetical protein
MAVRRFKYMQISDALSFLDVGKPAYFLAELMKNFYRTNTKVDRDLLLDHVVLKYTQRNIPVHSALLKEWWQEQLSKQPQSVQQQFFA